MVQLGRTLNSSGQDGRGHWRREGALGTFSTASMWERGWGLHAAKESGERTGLFSRHGCTQLVDEVQ